MIQKINLQMFAEETPAEPKAEEKPVEKTYSQDEVDRIVKGKKAEWDKAHQKEQQRKAEEERKATEAERLAKMTEDQRREERIKQLEEKVAESDRRDARIAMAKEARVILQNANISINDELLENLLGENAEATKANCESFIELFNKAVEKRVKEAYKGETPRKGAAPTLTKEQILAVKNTAERQKLIRENIGLFK